ncbi:hypothetical protein SCHPADRAFT_938779 [Schizopora paradoxa]|uniref:Uncharacterized protein n=1 Tax=Schizopora paradoxa TaxID=27342 RepID=A0A0H2RV33_9AGAM|nr:hypothetical protein SCHPADRAFT_938779 [Schizopora paradoxa]
MNNQYEELPKYEANAPEDIQHDAGVLIDSYIHPISGARRSMGLSMPFCLPQIGSGFDSPVARGYNRVLEQVGISQTTFLDFVDGLNMAMISSPPLQIVNVAGMALGFVPHWAFQVAGAAIQTGAHVGMHTVSKTLSDRYLRAANERLFAPVSLRVRLCNTRALRVLVGHPNATNEKPSKLKKFGQKTGDVVLSLPLPIMKKAVRFFMDKAPPIDPNITDPLTRRLMIMHGYILPVEYGRSIPPPSNPNKILDKMNGFAVGRKSNKVEKKERDAADRRARLAGMPLSMEGRMSKDYRRSRSASESKDTDKKLKQKVDADALQEHRANENLVWLVILNEEDDAKINGKDVVDSTIDNSPFKDEDPEVTRGRRHAKERDVYDPHAGLEDYYPQSQTSSTWKDSEY